MAAWFPAWAQPVSSGITAPLPTVSGNDITLRIARQTMRIDGKVSRAIGINGTVPAPLVRLKEGQNARLTVVNDLDEDSSIHWHGLILPFQMDGVPGVSFPGIKPRSKFVYEFPVVQSGTYWYHSHSGLQEQLGHYGPIVIDPAGADPIGYDREHVVVLSDHSQLSPEAIFRKLKVNPGHFNMQRQTLAGLLAGKDQPLKERIDWGKMRMDPTDVADVNGSTYTFLVNGHGPRDNWTALFSPGERVRLRIVNASAMTIFNVRIPGLRMTVVQADGLNVVPTEIDEGMGRATLAPRAGMVAEVPPLRERPLATMKDMGMGDMSGGAMAGMDHSGGDMGAMPMPASDPSCPPEHAKMGHCTPAGESGAMAGMDHGSGGGMQHSMRDFSVAPQVKRDPSVQTISPMPMDRMGEPGQGLENVGHKVLTYHDLVALERNPDTRAASRSLDIHLTGNMERFMWSFDGIKMSDYHEPIPFIEGERVRINLINDSMILYHMHAGMMRVVSVRPKGDGE